MRSNKLLVKITFPVLAALGMAISSCAISPTASTVPDSRDSASASGETQNPEIYAIYAAYVQNMVEAGTEPLSYSEWLKTIKGERGEQGPQGEKGEPGKDGDSLLTGQGLPSVDLGKVGDSYINLGTWDYYIKTVSGWTRQGNLRGEKGDPGQNGTSFRTGQGAPDNALGFEGDAYLDLSSYSLYTKNGTEWVLIGNIAEQGIMEYASVHITNKMELSADWDMAKPTRSLCLDLFPQDDVHKALQYGRLSVTSSDESVISTYDLSLEALSAGTATITVNYLGKTDSVEIRVLEPDYSACQWYICGQGGLWEEGQNGWWEDRIPMEKGDGTDILAYMYSVFFTEGDQWKIFDDTYYTELSYKNVVLEEGLEEAFINGNLGIECLVGELYDIVVKSDLKIYISSHVTDTPVIGKDNIFYCAGIHSGGEADARSNPGYLYEWHGDGNNVTKFVQESDEYVLNYSGYGAWYGVQLFYTLPYSEPGDTYAISMSLYSDVSGAITMNGDVFTIVRGWNEISGTYTRGIEGGYRMSTFSIQLGVGATEKPLEGSLLKIKDIEIHDYENLYHAIEFRNGGKMMKKIMVRDGRTVTAPRLDIPEGKILAGWYDGEILFDPNVAVTESHAYFAKIVDASEIETVDVTFLFGDVTLGVQTIVKDTIPDLSEIQVPFGYAIDGWFLDPAFERPYESGGITESSAFYLKAHVVPTTYYHDNVLEREERVGDNGEFILEFHNHSYDSSWNIQVNFAPLTIGAAGENYEFSCEYKITGTTDTGSWQIYDNGRIAAGELMPSENFVKVTAAYKGGVLTSNNKFTMELGLMHPSLGDEGTVVVTVRNPSIVKKA